MNNHIKDYKSFLSESSYTMNEYYVKFDKIKDTLNDKYKYIELESVDSEDLEIYSVLYNIKGLDDDFSYDFYIDDYWHGINQENGLKIDDILNYKPVYDDYYVLKDADISDNEKKKVAEELIDAINNIFGPDYTQKPYLTPIKSNDLRKLKFNKAEIEEVTRNYDIRTWGGEYSSRSPESYMDLINSGTFLEATVSKKRGKEIYTLYFADKGEVKVSNTIYNFFKKWYNINKNDLDRYKDAINYKIK